MPVPVKPPIKKIYIELYWSDQHCNGSKYFNNIKEFVEFLIEHPDLAKEIGFKKPVNGVKKD